MDVHAGVVDDRPRLVGRLRRCPGHHSSGSRRARPRRGRPVVGPRRITPAAHPDDRRGGCVHDGRAGADRLLALTACRRGDGRRLRGHGQRQRSGVHRDRRNRGAVLERPRAGHAEHQPVADRRDRATAVRCADHRGRLLGRVRGLRRLPSLGPAAGSGERGRRLDYPKAAANRRHSFYCRRSDVRSGCARSQARPHASAGPAPRAAACRAGPRPSPRLRRPATPVQQRVPGRREHPGLAGPRPRRQARGCVATPGGATTLLPRSTAGCATTRASRTATA